MNRVNETRIKNIKNKTLSPSVISNIEVKCLKVWAATSIFYLIWIIAFKTHYGLSTSDFPFEEIYNVVSSIGYMLSLLIMWYNRKSLTNVTMDLTRFLHERNGVLTALQVKLRRLTLGSFLIGFLATFSWVTMILVTKNGTQLEKYMRIYAFLPDNDALTYFLFCVLTLLYFLTFLSFRIVVSAVLITFISALISQSLTVLIDSVASIRNDRVAFNDMYRVLDDFETISSYLDRFNDAMSGVTLIWYVGALTSCCLSVTNSIIEFSYDQKFKVWNLPVYFQEVGMLVALIVVACKVADKMASLDGCLAGLRGRAVREGRVADLSLISQQLKTVTAKSGLKIGNTFVINKNLLISFIGVSATYAVVYLQLNRRAMNALYGVENNSSSVDIYD